jgi:hypothetical protein
MAGRLTSLLPARQRGISAARSLDATVSGVGKILDAGERIRPPGRRPAPDHCVRVAARSPSEPATIESRLAHRQPRRPDDRRVSAGTCALPPVDLTADASKVGHRADSCRQIEKLARRATSEQELRSATSQALATASEPVELVAAGLAPSRQIPATAATVESVATLDPSIKQRPDSGTSLINWWYLDLCAVHARHLHRLPVPQAHRSYRRSLGVSSPTTRASSNGRSATAAGKTKKTQRPQPRRPASRDRARAAARAEARSFTSTRPSAALKGIDKLRPRREQRLENSDQAHPRELDTAIGISP